MQPMKNLLNVIRHEVSNAEIVETLVKNPNFRVERIVSWGHASPPDFWYEQTQDEWITVLAGEAQLQIEDQQLVHLKPGDHLNLPAFQRHRVHWTTPDEATVWLAVFYTAERT